MNAKRHVVIHLTDLHFGQDTSRDQIAARDLALAGVVKTIDGLESDWRPTLVCISGDIGWKSGNQAPRYRRCVSASSCNFQVDIAGSDSVWAFC
jgi:hypothetical protein